MLATSSFSFFQNGSGRGMRTDYNEGISRAFEEEELEMFGIKSIRRGLNKKDQKISEIDAQMRKAEKRVEETYNMVINDINDIDRMIRITKEQNKELEKLCKKLQKCLA